MLESPETLWETRPRVIVGIPAYNEGQFIGEIVLKCREFADDVIVVDDGSTDDTAKVAKTAGASVIIREINGGAGEATKSCFEEARRKGARVLVTLDGDGQHNPEEITQVVAPVLAGRADLVICSRFLTNHSTIPRYRRFGINVITWLYDIGHDFKISDAQSCFRAYGEKALQSLDIKEQGFAFSVELLIKARQRGLTIIEVPISCVYHTASHSANPLLHGIGVALAVIKLRLRSAFRRLTRGNA
jgi:glycosyltransferase involved in cell wall biosynthesis